MRDPSQAKHLKNKILLRAGYICVITLDITIEYLKFLLC